MAVALLWEASTICPIEHRALTPGWFADMGNIRTGPGSLSSDADALMLTGAPRPAHIIHCQPAYAQNWPRRLSRFLFDGLRGCYGIRTRQPRARRNRLRGHASFRERGNGDSVRRRSRRV